MKERLNFRQLIAVASMLFGLFFGAGNLIFPVHMGQLAGANSYIAALGFIVTAVGLPLIGVAAFGISRSDDLLAMSSRVGKGYGVFFTCALYLTIGPLFAIPRCAATSFTIGVEPMLTGGAVTELAIFSVIFFALVLFFSLRPSKILTWVGRIINPLFLVFLAVLVVTALVKPVAAVSSVAPEGAYASSAFSAGFLDGYNTMDALASLAFGVIVVGVIRDLGIKHDAAVAGNTVRAGVFSCVFMGLIYLAMTIIGAQSRGAFAVSANGGIALADIAGYYFGTAGQVILAVTVTLACLKTAIGLVTSCAEIFRVLFPKSMSYKAWAIVFSVVSLLITNVGLTQIIDYSVPLPAHHHAHAAEPVRTFLRLRQARVRFGHGVHAGRGGAGSARRAAGRGACLPACERLCRLLQGEPAAFRHRPLLAHSCRSRSCPRLHSPRRREESDGVISIFICAAYGSL